MSGSERLRDAVAELYAGDPDGFVARRSELAAQAKSAGDGAAAKQIAGLRKPTRSAWVVNQLARAEPAAAGRLAELGAELRAAQDALDGAAIRQLSQQRRELIDALARDAFTAAGERSPSASVREEVVTTLSAALVDPEVAEQMRAGVLERVVSRDGLGGDPGATGELAAWAAAGPRAGGSRSGGGASAGGSWPGGGSTVIPLRPRTARVSPAGAGSAAGSSGGGRAARPSAQVTRLAAARAKAERAQAERERAERERRRKAIIAAEQAVTRADRAQRSTARTEQAQENTIGLLESELAEARQKLTEARLQARRARTAQRQARRALDKLRDAPED